MSFRFGEGGVWYWLRHALYATNISAWGTSFLLLLLLIGYPAVRMNGEMVFDMGVGLRDMVEQAIGVVDGTPTECTVILVIAFTDTNCCTHVRPPILIHRMCAIGQLNLFTARRV